MYKKLIGSLVLLLVILLIIFLGYKAFHWLTTRGDSPSIDTSHASVVSEIRALNRLETASFTLEKVIEAGVNGNFFSNILFGDRILLIAHGTIVAGFDLSKLKDTAVTQSDTILSITLPAPEILSASLDNTQTKVYDRKQGLLVNDINLESKARASAQGAIRQDACTANILAIASENARTQLKAMFSAAGFKEINIYIPQGICQ